MGTGGQRLVRERSRRRKRWQWKATEVKAVEKGACVGPKGIIVSAAQEEGRGDGSGDG